MIPYARQNVSEVDIQAVVKVLRSDFLTQGSLVPEFEMALATRVGVKHSVATNSATSALHIACLALEIGPGDIVWTSPISFVASANCALFCGASVNFVDIDAESLNICTASLEIKLKEAARAGDLPKAIIAVHMAGRSCDMEKIAHLADEYGIALIEDASHALGANYKDTEVGSCTYSAISVFSFHPVKIITSGEGGMAVTNDAKLAAKMRLLRSHGVTRDQQHFQQHSDEPWRYEQHILGFNYRMNDIEAALGLSQLSRLDRFISERRRLAEQYSARLADTHLKLPKTDDTESGSAWHLYIIQTDDSSGESRRKLYDNLKVSGISANIHYEPIHLQPFYRKFGFEPGNFPQAEKYARQCLSIPLFPGLSCDDQQLVVESLRGLAS